MRNRIIFIVGLALLVLVVWASTMIGISLNKKSSENNGLYLFGLKKQNTIVTEELPHQKIEEFVENIAKKIEL